MNHDARANGTREEIRRLQRCLNDLVAVSALPAVWMGQEPSQIANSLVDALMRVLHLEFVYLRLGDAVLDSPSEWARRAGNGPDARPELGRSLERWLAGEAPNPRLLLPNPVGEGVVSAALFRVGLRDEVGRLLVGSPRPDFPSHVELLLLQAAANQAAIALQEARHLREQRQATEREILERSRAEDRIRQDERELRLLVDFLPQLIMTLEVDGIIRYVNRAGLEYLGYGLDELSTKADIQARIHHPEDLDHVRRMVAAAFAQGTPCEMETRLRRHDGRYRWFLIRYEPLRDEQQRIVRWYGTGTDIDDRKRAEERIREENLALREEVHKASMAEEIVGSSVALGSVLAQVAKVAPTDSTVLITGETGTGKELVARAIHKQSPRAAQAFVSVNCSAIPSGLIASELFGHEKGAFTGAHQRRLGRFELAEGGTIFLDEIGELPAETQVALLRVLQERQFERVGGGRPIRADVRVIAATNRDLEAAITSGLFRADLFYRLNVFPIEMPSLRDRREDIPGLVQHFVDRYAGNSGKKIERINQESLALLQSYAWPGNIRELQNVIERSVIVSNTATLTVDERWFLERRKVARGGDESLAEQLHVHERKTIESALAESRGKVAGPTGAAVRLGMPRSTLDSRIKALGIDKARFKTRH